MEYVESRQPAFYGSIVMMRSAFFHNKLKVLLCYLSDYVF